MWCTPQHRLGFAVQMCTARYVGRFLPDDPSDPPWSVIDRPALRRGSRTPWWCSGEATSLRGPRTTTPGEIPDALRLRLHLQPVRGPRVEPESRTFRHGRAWAHAVGPWPGPARRSGCTPRGGHGPAGGPRAARRPGGAARRAGPPHLPRPGPGRRRAAASARPGGGGGRGRWGGGGPSVRNRPGR
ncbi:DUF4158 domain-containing protein [Streptomyces poriticola]|uniref:DUF4158 domain-containing protein n=1 Tax=Streptomyces poriticola TaxID=3120506 RepID=UPI0038CD45EB